MVVTQGEGMRRYRLVVDFIDDAGHSSEDDMADRVAAASCAVVNEHDMTVLDYRVDYVNTLRSAI